MRCDDNADDVLVLFFLSFVLSFCKSNDIYKKTLTIVINTDAANMQKSNK